MSHVALCHNVTFYLRFGPGINSSSSNLSLPLWQNRATGSHPQSPYSIRSNLQLFDMYSATELLATGESDIFTPDDWFFASEQAPTHVPVDGLVGGGEIPFFDPYLMSFSGMLENSNKAGFFSDLPPVSGPSPNYMDSKDSPASSPSDDGSFPALELFSAYSWDIEEEYPVTVTNPALIIKVEEVSLYSEQITTKQEDLYEDMDLAFQTSEQTPGSQADFTPPELPLDLFSFGSCNLMSIPTKKICRGRRVPTVEIVEGRIVKQINYTKQKPRRDAFAERCFACGYVDCRKCFKRREHLVRHQRSAHSSDKREYYCKDFEWCV